MNLDLTSSSSRRQKNTTQKKSYKPKKLNTNNTRKSNISIHFPPPKASHNLSSKKKTVTNLFFNQKSLELLLHRYKSERSPIQPYWRGSLANFHVPRQLHFEPTMFAEGIKVALSLSLPLPAKILNSFAGISVFYKKRFKLCKKNCCVEVSMQIFLWVFPWAFHAWIGLKVVFLCGFYCKGGVFLELGVWLLRKHGKMIEKLVNVHAIQLPNFYMISKLIFFFC